MVMVWFACGRFLMVMVGFACGCFLMVMVGLNGEHVVMLCQQWLEPV